MKKITIFLVLILTTFLSVGCTGPGLSDYSYKVAGNYELVRSSGHDIEVVPQGGWDSSNPPPMIPAKVVEIAWDYRYIVAKQLGLKKAYPDNPDNSYEIPDKNVVNYWILDTSEPKIYGPYDSKVFEAQREKLNIPTSLKLKAVGSYNKE